MASPRLTCEQADKLSFLAITLASHQNDDVAVVVLDVDGFPILQKRMDHCPTKQMEIAYQKAFYSIQLRLSSKGFSLDALSKEEQVRYPEEVCKPGGVLIRSGHVIGAVGVAGCKRPDQNEELVTTALSKCDLSTNTGSTESAFDVNQDKPTYIPTKLWGNVFINQDFPTLGCASYHFVSPSEVYLSFEHPSTKKDWPALDDNSPLPARVALRDIQWNEESRVFGAKIYWKRDYGSRWQKCNEWIFDLQFSHDYSFILAGAMSVVEKNRPVQEEWAQFGYTKEMVYTNAAVPEDNISTVGQYIVELKAKDEWIKVGPFVIGSRSDRDIEDVNIFSDNNGETLKGDIHYAGERSMQFRAQASSTDGVYTVKTQKGEWDDPWIEEKQEWLLGNQRVKQLKVVSTDDGLSLFGEVSYVGDSTPLSFRANRAPQKPIAEKVGGERDGGRDASMASGQPPPSTTNSVVPPLYSNPLYNPEILWGNTFIHQEFKVGCSSFHFVSEAEGAYISFEHTSTKEDWPPLDNGMPLPARAYFREAQYNHSTFSPSFHGRIMWKDEYGSSWQGCDEWVYDMVFDRDFSNVVSGSMSALEAGKTEEEEWAVFGGEIVYMNAAKTDISHSVGQYMVEVKSSSDTTWQKDGVWVLGCMSRADHGMEEIDIISEDKGKNFKGEIKYVGDRMMQFRANYSGKGNTYSIKTQKGEFIDPWVAGSDWSIGSREDKLVTALKVSSTDDGKSLFGEIKYAGEGGDFRFRASKC